ncbi:elongation of fatty acids protein 3-like [Vigna radiata var. radiata]|uniref:Elongation of fatty acids protein 3-like n=1 Tax=Vigna radiata var. radiata TaxID=3916 RepID=A0A1S3VPV1_VIGRR|nr:elongation of fatty acids protein 3-like [Vigna radiata var. radiata]
MYTSPSGGTLGKATAVMRALNFYLSEHPVIVSFRWSHALWGSTWSFLFYSISLYVVLSIFVHLILAVLLRRGQRVPLGPLPALHSLSMSLISAIIFAGLLLSATSEIRETRWLWRRSKTPLEWLLCFPLGTRPSGRVFFWSYVFYLSRYVHMLSTVSVVLQRRKLVFFKLFYHAISTFMSFLWLEFSQSFQVLAILFTTLAFFVIYGYRFWTSVAATGARLPLVLNCQILLLGCNLVCHVGVLLLHFFTGGCNGIGAWVLNSVLNGAILMLFMRVYLGRKRKPNKNMGDYECAENKIALSCSVFCAGKEADSNKLKSG